MPVSIRQRSDENPPPIGIIILNHNGERWLPQICDSIRAQRCPHVRVYLADNASNDNSVENTLHHYPEVSVIRLGRNWGYCMAYNLAMPQAFKDGCEWVIWANNDIRLDPACLQELLRTARRDPRIGILGPAFREWKGTEPNYYIQGNHPHAIPAINRRSPEPLDVNWVEGSFLMVSRRCVEMVGPLDPYLFFYWEEADFCRRARYQGWRVVLVPSAVARHYAGGWSNAEKTNQETANLLQTRNYYVYQFTNPFQGFLRNCADALHLFLVKMKEALLSRPEELSFHLRVFGGLVREIRLVQAKWKRDRAGTHPSPLSGENGFPKIDVYPGRKQV